MAAGGYTSFDEESEIPSSYVPPPIGTQPLFTQAAPTQFIQNATPFACQYEDCGKAFAGQRELSKHIDRVHEKRFTCDVCQVQSGSKKDLHRHYWAHHPITAELENIPTSDAQCPTCGVPGRSDNIARHRKNQHH